MFAATKSFFTNEAAAGAPTPSWSLDFSTGTPSGYTLTRASSGTYVDSSGYIASASTDVARLTHNSSGSRLGLLVEGQRENIAARSEDFGNAYWLKYQTTVTTNSVAAPDNQTTADSVMEGNSGGSHLLYTDIAGQTGNQVYTFSSYVKKGGRQYFILAMGNGTNSRDVVFDLDNGTVATTRDRGSPTDTANTITDVGNGWYRCTVTAKMATSGTQTVTIIYACTNRSDFSGTLQFDFPSYTGTNQVGAYVWGAQLEAASTASSYIPTTTASVTRSADLVHVLDSSITSWGDPGALVVHFYPPGQAGTLISTDDASAEQLGIEASSTTAVRAFWSNGQTATGTMTTGVQKAVHYWNGTASSFCLNGGTVQTGTNNVTTFGNIDFVTFGAEATDSSGTPGTFSQHSNLIIRKIEFYGQSLTSGNLQTITT